MTGFQKIESKKYFSLLKEVPFKTFFHTLEWESFLEKEFSWLRFERYLWRDAALLSIARCKLFGKKKVASHPFCEYGGPLVFSDSINLESFNKDFKNTFGASAKVKFHPHMIKENTKNTTNIKPSIFFGVASFFIERFAEKTSDDVWQNFRKTLRHEIRKSERCHLDITERISESDLAQFYRLYLATMKRHKNIPLPISAFRFFNASKEAKIFLAKKNRKVIGGSIFLFYKPFIHYFINASDSKFRNCNVSHAILWHSIQKYVGKEYDYFDLGGTRKGSPLEVFKRGWGAQERPIYEIKKGRQRGGNSLLRNVLGVIPYQIMKYANYYALWAKI